MGAERAIESVHRFFLLPVKRSWVGLVMYLLESGISVRFVFSERRQSVESAAMKLCTRPCLKGHYFYSSWTNQDKTSHLRNNARNPLTEKV